MPRKPVAVVVAMRRELAPLLRVPGRRENGIEFFELENAVVTVGGIGMKAAANAAEAVFATYEPDVLISAGLAGALTAALHAGDVVHAREVVNADTGDRFAAGDGNVIIATAASISGPDEKRSLAARWKSDVVDMEAAAVAAVAQHREIEFAAVKAISDELDFKMPPVGQFVDSNGKFDTLRFATYVALHPKWWSAVRRLNANTRVAVLHLSDAVIHLIDRWSPASVEGKTVRS